ncbi:MAG: DNA polymerase III subunit delta [Bacteroidetes bacterium]|nr:MAG: DNA polymerase III subunit delta [Bacteroidota bacterium]
MSYPKLLEAIRKKAFSPVYYLHGEEGYFIDKLIEALAADGAVLTEGEAAFNREVFYGPDAKAGAVINACRSFPVMAERRLIIVKEAHRMPKPELEKLGPYLENPVPSSVLVLAFKDRQVGLPKALAAAAKKAGVDYHARKMYERDVQQWTQNLIREAGLEVHPDIPGILVDYLGTNLNLIENELNKMMLVLKAQGKNHLSRELVFEMIDIDKEFNVFALIQALSERRRYRAHMVINRLTQNTKINPPVLIIGGLYRFFHQLALVHKFQLRDPNSIKDTLRVNYYQARDFAQASKQYNKGQVYRNIGYIQDADLALKGLVPTQMDEGHILKTLVWKLLT